MAHEHYRTKAIFLNKENRAEADQVFILFTEGFGKIKITGKAIRKTTSKLRPGAEVFYFSDIEFIEGKAGKILTDALVQAKPEQIYQSPAKFSKALNVSEKIDHIFFYEQQDSEVWALLLRFFDLLNKARDDSGEIDNVAVDFFNRLTKIMGCALDDFN